MKFFFLLSFLAVLATTVLGWDKEDHEIFDIVSEIEASEGKGTTFYSWLDVPHTASTSEIARAYRKMSMQIHPDKNPNDKRAHERFARLGVISTILRNAESRKRYDFFYKNGVPKWRGTGYYYSRFRPGLGTVLVFLALVTSGMQYLVQGINYRRDLERVEGFISEAKLAAWGPKLIPIDGARKVKVSPSGSQRYDEDGNPLGPGRTVDMIVQGDDVFIVDNDGQRHLLNTSAAVPPSFSRLWPIALTRNLFGSAIGRLTGPKHNGSDDVESEEDESVSGSGYSTPQDRAPSGKVGGKRRKNTKKR